VSAIADSAAGYAALCLMPADTGVLTAEFKINFLAPAAGERILARGRVVKAGRTLTLAQAEVFAKTREQEKLIALLTATLMVVKGRDGVRHLCSGPTTPHNLPLPTLGKLEPTAATGTAQRPWPSGNLQRDPTYR
jgi:acyl-CoA hydrolase